MPKYTFKCRKCKAEKQLFTSVKRVVSLCECGDQMDRQMPSLSGPAQVRETVDKLLGKTWIDDQVNILKARSDDYFWAVEVPRLVQSGTYGMDTMLENDWVYYDDKEQLQTRTKPPSKD